MTYGHGKNKQTAPVVAGIGSARFTQLCDTDSPNYEPSYCNYDRLESELFQQDDAWISQDMLLKAMEMLTSYHDYTVCCETESNECNQQGVDKSTIFNLTIKTPGRSIIFDVIPTTELCASCPWCLGRVIRVLLTFSLFWQKTFPNMQICLYQTFLTMKSSQR